MDTSIHLSFNTPLNRNKIDYFIGSNNLFKKDSNIDKYYFNNSEPFIELKPEINQYNNISIEKETSYKSCNIDDYGFMKKY